MNTQSLPTLNGPRVQLRKPRPSDWEGRFALGNSAEIQRLFGSAKGQFRPLTEDAAKGWVTTQQNERFAWVILRGDKLIGSVRLHSVNYADKRAVLAIGILDPDSLGQGLGVEAMQLVTRYGFDGLGLHRISLRVLDFNARAIKAYAKIGFREEGRERESAFIDGQWHDDILMGLLASDFAAQVPA